MDISKDLADILDFYSLLVDNDEKLHKDLLKYIAEAKDVAYDEGVEDNLFEQFKEDPFNEDFELCERIGNKQAFYLFKDCVTLEDFKEVLREVETQNCIAMPVLGFPYDKIKFSV